MNENTRLSKLQQLHDEFEELRQKEHEITTLTSRLLRESLGDLNDIYCDLLFESDRRRFRIRAAQDFIQGAITSEEKWKKLFP